MEGSVLRRRPPSRRDRGWYWGQGEAVGPGLQPESGEQEAGPPIYRLPILARRPQCGLMSIHAAILLP